MAASCLPISGCISSTPRQSSLIKHSTILLQRHLMVGQRSRLFRHAPTGHAFRMLANPNDSSAKKNSSKEITMVDPLEAKRLAENQMKEIKAKEKFKRRRRIEAINGAWAVIGLTAGLVVEGHTGKGILGQLAGYWQAILSFFVR